MLVWLTLPFYDFCGFRSVAVNSVYKLQFFLHLFYYLSHAICYSYGADNNTGIELLQVLKNYLKVYKTNISSCCVLHCGL